MRAAAAAAAAPPAEQVAERPKMDRLSLLILYMPFIGVTLISKFAVTLGATEILIGVPTILAATLLGILSGRLQPDPTRLALYLGMCAVLTAEQAFAAGTFSITSLLLIVMLHLAYAFKLEGVGDDSAPHLERFLNFSILICILGIAQYLGQFVIGARYAYPIEHFTPAAFITHRYNYLNALSYGSTTYKANGLFLLEPSYYSQLLGVALLLEIAGPQRLWRMACYGAGFVVAFSGTGLIMVAVTFPTLLIAYKRYSLLVAAIIGGFLVIAFGESLGLSLFLDRSQEFNTTSSSGYMRYVGPVHLINQYLWNEPKRWLFGLGAGMMMRTTPWPMYNASETGWAKLILEFGLVGATTYFVFLYACIFRSRQPSVLRVALCAMTLLNGIFDPPHHGMILTMLIWMPELKGAWVFKKAPKQPRFPEAPPLAPRRVVRRPVRVTQAGYPLE
jgi:hypothetical protein